MPRKVAFDDGGELTVFQQPAKGYSYHEPAGKVNRKSCRDNERLSCYCKPKYPQET